MTTPLRSFLLSSDRSNPSAPAAVVPKRGRHWVGAALLVLLAACANVKGEQTAWGKHNEAVATHATRWPGFKGALTAQQAKAKPLWDEANKVTDEKSKIEKMKAANEAFTSGILGKLDTIKEKGDDLEKTSDKLRNLNLAAFQHQERKAAVEKAEQTTADVDDALKNARPKDDAEAIKVADAQIERLSTVSSYAEVTLARLKSKKGK